MSAPDDIKNVTAVHVYSLHHKALSEFLGMAITIYTGESALANELLPSTKGHGMGWGWTVFTFGFAFFIPLCEPCAWCQVSVTVSSSSSSSRQPKQTCPCDAGAAYVMHMPLLQHAPGRGTDQDTFLVTCTTRVCCVQHDSMILPSH
jgi:hypothetical protein